MKEKEKVLKKVPVKRELSEEKWVIIRVWRAQDDDGFARTSSAIKAEKGKVGHVSIQTSNIYASFWPAKAVDKSSSLSAKGYLMPAPEADIAAEQADPDQVIILYSLNIESLEQQFEAFKKSISSSRWTLLGDGFLRTGQSCSGLTYDLLVAGGIKDICESYFIADHVVSTPNLILKMVLSAKKQEESLFEITKSFRSPLGMSPELMDAKDAQSCIIL